jgi:hypothetical protein
MVEAVAARGSTANWLWFAIALNTPPSRSKLALIVQKHMATLLQITTRPGPETASATGGIFGFGLKYPEDSSQRLLHLALIVQKHMAPPDSTLASPAKNRLLCPANRPPSTPVPAPRTAGLDNIPDPAPETLTTLRASFYGRIYVQSRADTVAPATRSAALYEPFL